MKKTIVGLIALALSALATTMAYASPNSVGIGISPPTVDYQSQVIAKTETNVLIAKTAEVQTGIGLMASADWDYTAPALASTTMGTKGKSPQVSSVNLDKRPSAQSISPQSSTLITKKFPGIGSSTTIASTTGDESGNSKSGVGWTQALVFADGGFTVASSDIDASPVLLWQHKF